MRRRRETAAAEAVVVEVNSAAAQAGAEREKGEDRCGWRVQMQMQK